MRYSFDALRVNDYKSLPIVISGGCSHSMIANCMTRIDQIMSVYAEIDAKTKHIMDTLDFRCPPGCGICCRRHTVEVSVLEALPVGLALFAQQKAEQIMEEIEFREVNENPVCALFEPHPIDPEKGICTQYQHRPLLCRLFGFAARKNKYGISELVTCKIIKQQQPEVIQKAEQALSVGFDFPIYQDYFMRIAMLEPVLGYRIVPINQAIKEALGYMYLKSYRQE